VAASIDDATAVLEVPSMMSTIYLKYLGAGAAYPTPPAR